MQLNIEVPASAGSTAHTHEVKMGQGESKVTIEVAKSGHPDRRFGIVPKLGKDGCGY